MKSVPFVISFIIIYLKWCFSKQDNGLVIPFNSRPSTPGQVQGLTGFHLLVHRVPFWSLGERADNRVFALGLGSHLDSYCWCCVLIYLKFCQELGELMTSFSLGLCRLPDSSSLLTSGNLLTPRCQLTALASRLGLLGLLQTSCCTGILTLWVQILGPDTCLVLSHTQVGPAEQLHSVVTYALFWNNEWISVLKQGSLLQIKIKKSIFQRSNSRVVR